MEYEQYRELCDKVCIIAREAGQFMLNERNTFSIDKVEHKGVNDFVSYVDKHDEKIIVKGLTPLIADAGFITEEKTVAQSDNKQYTWIIDPLDGTTNYIHGFTPYAVSIGLVENGQLTLGVVYIVDSKECFYAWKGSKAYLNGNEIQASNITSIADSLVISGFPHSEDNTLDKYLNIIRYLTFNSHGVRRVGSAAADLVYIACGRAEAFFQTDLNSWDVASGAFIAIRAGATITDFNGGNNYLFGNSLIATANTELHNKMHDLLNKHFSYS